MYRKYRDISWNKSFKSSALSDRNICLKYVSGNHWCICKVCRDSDIYPERSYYFLLTRSNRSIATLQEVFNFFSFPFGSAVPCRLVCPKCWKPRLFSFSERLASQPLWKLYAPMNMYLICIYDFIFFSFIMYTSVYMWLSFRGWEKSFFSPLPDVGLYSCYYCYVWYRTHLQVNLLE